MKKRHILRKCSVLLTAAALLASCQNSKLVFYESVVEDVPNDGTGVHFEFSYWTGRGGYKRNDAKRTLTVSLPDGTASLTGKYYFSDRNPLISYSYDMYRCEGGYDFKVRSDTGELVYLDLTNGEYYETEPYLPDLENPKESAIEMAEEIAQMYLTDIDAYERTVSERSPSWDHGDDEAYNLTEYSITYRKNVKGFRTRDLLSVSVSSKGHLLSLSIGDLDAFTGHNIRIDEDMLTSSIEAKLNEAYGAIGYRIISYEIADQILVKSPANQVCVWTSVDVEIESDTDARSTILAILTAVEK